MEIFDSIADGFDYVIHFEWLGDIGEFFSDAFSNLSELSTYGIGFGIGGVIFLLVTKQWMLDSFIKLMPPTKGLITTILTFIVTFIACYFLGNRFQNT
jgi:hypothetical protein